jgi:hypothetical protein
MLKTGVEYIEKGPTTMNPRGHWFASSAARLNNSKPMDWIRNPSYPRSVPKGSQRKSIFEGVPTKLILQPSSGAPPLHQFSNCVTGESPVVLAQPATFGIANALRSNALSTSTAFSPLYQVGSPRSIQLWLKIIF